MGRYTSGGIGRDIVAGAVAGAAAVWLVDRLQLNMNHAAVTRDQPTGVDPAHAMAAMAADKAGADIGPAHDNTVGHTVHYGVGIGLGALYGLLRGMAPSVATGRGAIYGLTAFLLADEIGTPALGLAKGPLHYPARDHARGALAHTLFGVATDLGTRLISPWRDEVVILHGPSISERLDSGRQAIADGRDYLYAQGRPYVEQGMEYARQGFDQGRDYARQGMKAGTEYVRQGRDYVSDVADDARSRLDDVDLHEYADQGGKKARGFFKRVREYLPDPDDVADMVDRGRRYASGMAASAVAAAPDRDDVQDLADRGRKRARQFADDVRSRVPDRGDVEDVVEQGRRRGRRAANRVRDNAPDSGDISDLAERGRKRVRDLADQARTQAQDGGSWLKQTIGKLLG